jgi:hypothetical protein
METLSLDQMEIVRGGVPMFGSITTCTDTSWFNPETGDYEKSCIVQTKTYFFWICTSTGQGDQDGQKYGSCSYNGYGSPAI